ncbi:MAG TPA: 4'-phosphopantetheinyl transferase superfamily protein [Nakamurella sp.]
MRWIEPEHPDLGGPTAVLAASAEVLARYEHGADWLTPAERHRGAALADGTARNDFVAAHLLVRLCAAAVTGRSPAELRIVQRCTSCGGRHGRPMIEGCTDVHVSLSHAGGVVAAASGPQPVGVDVERVRTLDGRAALYARTLHPAEQADVQRDPDPDWAFLRHWVRKEAVIKSGFGDLAGMRHIDLSSLSGVAQDDAPRPLRLRSAGQDLLLRDFTDDAHNLVGAVVHSVWT